jgi:hypothetical protein
MNSIYQKPFPLAKVFSLQEEYPVYEGCLIPTPNIYFFILNIFMRLLQERYKLINPNISQSVYHCYNVHV